MELVIPLAGVVTLCDVTTTSQEYHEEDYHLVIFLNVPPPVLDFSFVAKQRFIELLCSSAKNSRPSYCVPQQPFDQPLC